MYFRLSSFVLYTAHPHLVKALAIRVKVLYSDIGRQKSPKENQPRSPL